MSETTQTGPLVTPTDTTVLYMSRRSKLRLVRIPKQTLMNPVTGQREVGAIPGQAVSFQDGALRVPKEGDVVMEDARVGEAQEIHDWLAKHRLHGDREEGFWRVDPTAPPVSQDEMRTLMQATLRLEPDTLVRMIEEERAGWGRAQIIEEAENALAQMEQMRLEAEAAAKKQGPKPKGTDG